MDYRKLISFGKSSFVISLPKDWIHSNKLRKGDLISVENNKDTLTLFAHTNGQDSQIEQRIVISVDNKSIGEIRREIIPAYINNYKMIIVIGKELKEKAKDIQQILHNLMALEIMEQTSDKILARDFLNMNEISIPNLIRKMDIITRAMISDSKRMFEEDLYENVFSRDEDVNRLSYLNYRAIRYALRNPIIASQTYKLTQMELLNLWMLTYHLEAIADEAKRVARYMRKIKLSKKEQQEVLDIFNAIEKTYTDMMKAYYDKDKQLAHEASSAKAKIKEKLNKFYERYSNTKYIGKLTEHLNIIAGNIHDIARSIYE